MVVVSGSWVRNVVQYPTTANDNDMVIPTNNMSAKAVLICRPNSHPFQDRTLCLDQPVKVGRSVARAKATQTNAIFDCKVLSRHHAVLWYDCGKFYLHDTKSSNGTFVNNNRLSSNEGEPHEVSSGDIVQFGVDVVENNNRKVTHGCIIATLKLYLPDGKEAKASPSLIEGNRQGYVPLDELYKLNQIIQEASQREQCLETKLLALQHVVEEAKRSAEESWQAYVGEERLLSRVAALEAQLTQAGKNIGDERLRDELSQLHEERTTYQVAAKESIRKLLAEQLEAVGSASEQQRARATAEQEVLLARMELEKAQEEVQQIAQQLSDERKKTQEEKNTLEQKMRELEQKLEEAETHIRDLEETYEMFRKFLPVHVNPAAVFPPVEQIGKAKLKLIIENDLKLKEEMIENSNNENSDVHRPNGVEESEQNDVNKTQFEIHHVTAQLAEIIEDPEEKREPETDMDSEPTMSDWDSQEDLSRVSDDSVASFVTVVDAEQAPADVTYRSDDTDTGRRQLESQDTIINDELAQEQTACTEETRVHEINSKTLKYQFQSEQNELRRKVENLELLVTSNKAKIHDLEASLAQEQETNSMKTSEIDELNHELMLFTQKWKESCNEAQQLKSKVEALNYELTNREKSVTNEVKDNDVHSLSVQNQSINNISVEELAAVEEELVILKEKFASVNEDKILLNKELVSLRAQYNSVCNKSHNTMFIYVGPLIVMCLYLLVTSIFS